MSINRFRIKTGRQVISGLFLFGLACLSSGPVTAAGTDRSESARAQFETDKAACRDNGQYRDVNVCIREAGAVYEARNRQKSQSTAFNSNFQENAIKRCRIFTGDERNQCERRIMDGPVEGSVKKGGVLYESRVREALFRNP